MSPLMTDKDFSDLVAAIQASVDKHKPLQAPIFHADLFPDAKSSFFSVFLDLIPAEFRQEHNCSTCQRFLDSFGDLCIINEKDGSLVPLFWSFPEEITVLELYKDLILAFRALFKGRKVKSEYQVLDESNQHLGKSPSGTGWTHFHAALTGAQASPRVAGGLDLETGFTMLSRVLQDNDLKTVNQVHHLIHEKLSYSASHRPALDWLQKLMTDLESAKGADRTNLIYLYSRKAWAGCLSSLRGGIIGELLSWVKQGLLYEDLEKKWLALADPLHHLRPTAAPAMGQVKVAEKTLADLGYTKEDLMRYWLATDELPEKAILWKDDTLWKGKKEGEEKEARDGMTADERTEEIFPVFRDKLAKSTLDNATTKVETPPAAISFRKFAKHILPTTTTIEIEIADRECFAFFSRGAPGSKSPFVFDSLDPNNTTAWHYWESHNAVEQAKLHKGWHRVNTITTFPHMWDYLSPLKALEWEQSKQSTEQVEGQGPKWIHSRHSVRFLFCIEGIEDASARLNLFPAALKNVFHGIRQTMEYFSKEGSMVWPHAPGDGNAYVGGIAFDQGHWYDGKMVKVTTNQGMVSTYNIALFD
jgi:hypothetical protein